MLEKKTYCATVPVIHKRRLCNIQQIETVLCLHCIWIDKVQKVHYSELLIKMPGAKEKRPGKKV